MSVMIIGAGKCGRGYLARLLAEAGESVVFADADKDLVGCFPEQYEISFFSDREKVVIKPEYTGNMEDPVIREYCKEADCIFVSVGIGNLPDVGKKLNGMISDRCKVILCENGNDACSAFLEMISGERRYGIAQAAVFCTTIENGGYNIISEDYSTLFCQRKYLTEELKYDFIDYVDDFEVLMKRKLYTYNTISAIISYAGDYYGYKEFTDAAKDEHILKMTEEYLEELRGPVCLEYGFPPESQDNFSRSAMEKFKDEKIKDSMERNARDPGRKLRKEERIMGPLRLIQGYGGNTSVLERVLAMCVCYQKDSEWTAFLKTHSVDEVLREVCMIEQGEPLYTRLLCLIAEINRKRNEGNL